MLKEDPLGSIFLGRRSTKVAPIWHAPTRTENDTNRSSDINPMKLQSPRSL